MSADLVRQVAAVLAGHADAEDRAAVQAALDASPQRSALVAAVREEAMLALAVRRALAGQAAAGVRARRRFAAPRHRPLLIGILAAAAMLLIAVGTVWLRREAGAPAPVRLESGDLRRIDGRAVLGAVPTGVDLVAAPGNVCAWRWRDGSHAELRGPARLRLDDGPGIVLALTDGDLALTVAPQVPTTPLTVRCPDAMVRVLGTVFTVRVRDGRSAVTVREGRVEVRPHGSPALVLAAGATWPPVAPRSWPLDRATGLDLHGAACSGEGLRTGPGAWAEVQRDAWLDAVQDGSWSVVLRARLQRVPVEEYGQLVGKRGWTCGLAVQRDGRVLFQHFDRDRTPLGVISEHPVVVGRWHHLCGVVDRRVGRTALFIDGTLVAQQRFDPAVAPFAYPAEPWRLGVGSPAAATCVWPAEATLADLHLYDRALDDQTAAALTRRAQESITPKSPSTPVTEIQKPSR